MLCKFSLPLVARIVHVFFNLINFICLPRAPSASRAHFHLRNEFVTPAFGSDRELTTLTTTTTTTTTATTTQPGWRRLWLRLRWLRLRQWVWLWLWLCQCLGLGWRCCRFPKNFCHIFHARTHAPKFALRAPCSLLLFDASVVLVSVSVSGAEQTKVVDTRTQYNTISFGCARLCSARRSAFTWLFAMRAAERESARERRRASAREMSRAERHAMRINVSFVFIYTIVRFCLRIFMCKTDRVKEAECREQQRNVKRERERDSKGETERKGERATHCRLKCCNCVQRVKIVSVFIHSCHHGLRMWHRERPDRRRSASTC